MSATSASAERLTTAPTSSEAALLAAARQLGGRTLAEVAADTGFGPIAPSHKGAVGMLVERALGADGGARPGPDFSALGIELKTLPIDAHGRPAESTFVCSVPRRAELDWAGSSVRAKLARVLWVPVQTHVPVPRRVIGSAFLWSPPPALEEILRDDWYKLTDLLAAGDERISARHGVALQLRPKARDASVRFRGADGEGAPLLCAPKAFYLRRVVTQALLEQVGLFQPRPQ